MGKALFSVENITMQFGGLTAVDSFQMSMEEGQLLGLIGPNGAGKTTVFNMITGVYTPTKGKILLNGEDITGLKPYQISEKGIARTFQNIRLFKDLTVLENVLIGSDQHIQYGLIRTVLRLPSFFKEEIQAKEKAMSLLSIFNLQDKADWLASNLPYGDQRKLEIVRALATNPKIILLDEPAAGMNHAETEKLMDLIAKIRKDFKLTVLLIEHDMKLVMGICERIFVLDHGEKIAEGNAESIQNNSKVIEAYLGVDIED
ncbi:MAG: ABC transporter ATP-binding protein [Bdellovibrionales bacterium]|nr:ABC transporter ATP-binding protein [Bdellovibrionales bacterium]